ncbi:hypothetical protein EV126DRAFT_97470 [Verticillium dahliae]|nr:hypothetical protein EV126DRAFT_97470 [Verticillium dahliae]
MIPVIREMFVLCLLCACHRLACFRSQNIMACGWGTRARRPCRAELFSPLRVRRVCFPSSLPACGTGLLCVYSRWRWRDEGFRCRVLAVGRFRRRGFSGVKDDEVPSDGQARIRFFGVSAQLYTKKRRRRRRRRALSGMRGRKVVRRSR